MNSLDHKHCTPCEGGIEPLDSKVLNSFCQHVPKWHLSADKRSISREFQFKNFFRTMSFVNAVAHMANKENHHPDLQISFNRCTVSYSTHAIDGLSKNDFICARQVDKLAFL